LGLQTDDVRHKQLVLSEHRHDYPPLRIATFHSIRRRLRDRSTLLKYYLHRLADRPGAQVSLPLFFKYHTLKYRR
jgi:hypothetical protein